MLQRNHTSCLASVFYGVFLQHIKIPTLIRFPRDPSGMHCSGGETQNPEKIQKLSLQIYTI